MCILIHWQVIYTTFNFPCSMGCEFGLTVSIPAILIGIYILNQVRNDKSARIESYTIGYLFIESSFGCSKHSMLSLLMVALNTPSLQEYCNDHCRLAIKDLVKSHTAIHLVGDMFGFKDRI